jgi:hypothetical protein
MHESAAGRGQRAAWRCRACPPAAEPARCGAAPCWRRIASAPRARLPLGPRGAPFPPGPTPPPARPHRPVLGRRLAAQVALDAGLVVGLPLAVTAARDAHERLRARTRAAGSGQRAAGSGQRAAGAWRGRGGARRAAPCAPARGALEACAHAGRAQHAQRCGPVGPRPAAPEGLGDAARAPAAAAGPRGGPVRPRRAPAPRSPAVPRPGPPRAWPSMAAPQKSQDSISRP